LERSPNACAFSGASIPASRTLMLHLRRIQRRDCVAVGDADDATRDLLAEYWLSAK